MAILWFLIIGITAGWLAGQFMKGGSFGVLGDLVVGVLGAMVGGFLLRIIGFHATGLIAQLLTATVGAVVLLFTLRFIKH